jgi:hypothetical protein
VRYEKQMALIWGPVIMLWITHIGLWPLYLSNLRAVKRAWIITMIVLLFAEPAYWLWG